MTGIPVEKKILPLMVVRVHYATSGVYVSPPLLLLMVPAVEVPFHDRLGTRFARLAFKVIIPPFRLEATHTRDLREQEKPSESTTISPSEEQEAKIF